MSQTTRENKRKAAKASKPAGDPPVAAGKWDNLTLDGYDTILRKAARTSAALKVLLYSATANATEVAAMVTELGLVVTSDVSAIQYNNGLDPENKYGLIEFRDPDLEGIEFWVVVCRQGGTELYGTGEAQVSDHVDVDLYHHVEPLFPNR